MRQYNILNLSNLIKYVERLKLELIGILKSDQFHTVSMHLTEIFVSKDMKVNNCYSIDLRGFS